jgi:hypothetical protein
MARGRPSQGAKRQVILRLPEHLYAEMIVLKPDLIDASREQLRYGSLNAYFLSLLQQDLEKRRQEQST